MHRIWANTLSIDDKSCYKSEDFCMENFKQFLDLPEWCVIAGGSVNAANRVWNNGSTKDYDLFILDYTPARCREIVRWASKFGQCRIMETQRYTEIHCGSLTPIQIIKRSYKSIWQILNSFDLSVCRAAFHQGQFWVSSDYEIAVATKTIPLNHKMNGKTYLSRLHKYKEKGFAIISPWIKEFEGSLLTIKNYMVSVNESCKTDFDSEYDEEIPESYGLIYKAIEGSISSQNVFYYDTWIYNKVYKVSGPEFSGLTDGVRLKIILKAGRIPSEQDITAMYNSYKSQIIQRFEEVCNSFSPASDGRCVTENNDPYMSLNEFLQTMK